MTSRASLLIRAEYQRLGKQYWDPENSTAREPVHLFNARLGVESADGRWSLIGSVKNLADERYNEEWVLGGFS